jgi:hypothetical protein
MSGQTAQTVSKVARLQIATESLRVLPHAHALHCIRLLQIVLPVFLLTGCWEKIEYQGTFPAEMGSSPAAAPPAIADETGGAQQEQVARSNGASNTARVDVDLETPPETSSEAPPTEMPPAGTPVVEMPLSNSSAMPGVEPVDARSPSDMFTTERAAWTLGSKFSLAALANDRGAAPESVSTWFDEARSMAERLNVPLANLPQADLSSPNVPSRAVLGYILDQEKAIGPKLATDHGDDHDALFRLAIRTNLLRVLNTPGSKPVEALSKSIVDLGPLSGLPIDTWQPLLDLLNDGATADAIRTAVPQMHEKVEQHLATEP